MADTLSDAARLEQEAQRIAYAVLTNNCPKCQEHGPCRKCVADTKAIILSALQQAQAPLLAALRKVPLFGPTDDHLGWRCVGCGSRSGINPDGSELHEKCAPDCYVSVVEAAINGADGK